MSSLFPLYWGAYLSIFLIFLRLLGIFIIAPAFSQKAIPAPFKLLLALVTAFALYPILNGKISPPSSHLSDLVVYAIRESAFGFLMGFTIYITFEGIHLAGQFIGYQMGFGTVGLMDPITQTQTSIIVPFAGWMALMVFFFTDMHHEVLRHFIYSFQVTEPLSAAKFEGRAMLELFISSTARLFVIAVKIAAPITLLVLCTNATVGVLARLLPQMHVMLFSFPITILLGLLIMYLIAPELLVFFENTLHLAWEDMTRLLKTV